MLVMQQIELLCQGTEHPKVLIEHFSTGEIIRQLDAVGVAEFDAD